MVAVKGKSQRVTIMEVFDRNESADRACKARTRGLLLSGIEALSGPDPAAARRIFDQCLELFPGDPAANNLLKCCA